MCELIRAAPCALEMVVLRHHLETHRASNTGRIVARSLAGAKLASYAAPDHALNRGLFDGPNTWILYPSPNARVPDVAPERLVVLDATWPQARKMYQRIPELRRLPALALPPPNQALPRMRKTQRPEQMSTAEACIAALRVLGDSSAADHLESTLREAVRRFALPKRKGPSR